MKNLTEINLEKSRSGVYKDTAENRRLHRVGQRYGEPKKEESSKGASSLPTKGDIESIMEDISDKFFDSKTSAKEKRTYIENYIGEGEYDRLWQKLSSKQFDSSTDEKNAFMEEVFEVLLNKQSVQSKPEAKTPSKVKVEGAKKPTSIRVKGRIFKVDGNGRILASAYGPQENVNKLLKFASENGYKLDWEEVDEKSENGVDKYSRGGYAGIGFGTRTNWDDRRHRLTKILAGLAEQNPELKNRLVDEILNIMRNVDGRDLKEEEGRELALFNFIGWLNRLDTEDKLKYIKEASKADNGSNLEEIKNTNGSTEQGKESFTRVNLADMPNAHKVNLKKYLSAKRKAAVDEAWNKADFDNVPKERAGVFQEGYNKLREQFNNNFDDMSKSERAELLYKILKMKNAMEKK